MKVGIIGSGPVGQALGLGFAGRGDEVMIGSREPESEKLIAWKSRAGERAATGSFAQAAAFAEVAILATGWSGTEHAIQLAGPENLVGKVLIDTTNPLAHQPGGPPTLALGYSDSAGEQVQRWLPEARVVKAFNIVGSAHMINPSFPDGPPDMFICGNDGEAKATVARLLTEFGWPVIDIGGIEGARLLEPLAMLWITYGVQTGGWNHAFRLLRK
jgi:predicted dinucleotide-binding enzyme